jgi:hypothetical protein
LYTYSCHPSRMTGDGYAMTYNKVSAGGSWRRTLPLRARWPQSVLDPRSCLALLRAYP